LPPKPRHLPGQAAPSFAVLLRQNHGRGLSPPFNQRALHGALVCDHNRPSGQTVGCHSVSGKWRRHSFLNRDGTRTPRLRSASRTRSRVRCQAPQPSSRAVAPVAVGVGKLYCCSCAKLWCDHNIGADVKVVEDLLMAPAEQFLDCDSRRSSVSACEWTTNVKVVLLLRETHGEESGRRSLCCVTCAAAICG
jgi:hypothetical protein